VTFGLRITEAMRNSSMNGLLFLSLSIESIQIERLQGDIAFSGGDELRDQEAGDGRQGNSVSFLAGCHDKSGEGVHLAENGQFVRV
jgi:hypothetical protein